ncbi:hypothetical protein AAC387_Pa04g0506 [Persea americana]
MATMRLVAFAILFLFVLAAAGHDRAGVYKIIVNHPDRVDKEEVGEQLKLLQELVPDWISGKMSSSGDFLFCVNKTRSPKSIHARLAEAE